MKLFSILLILTVFAATASFAADAPAPAIPPLETPVTTTNLLDETLTNEIVEAKVPGKFFTNFVGMELIQVGGFWAGKFEVTQKQFQKVMASNPSAFGGESRPVENISWNDAVAFCDRLTAIELDKKKLPKGYHYTLPTEGEWSSLVGDAALEGAVTSMGSTRNGTSTVGSGAPNSLGLYDVRGNVMEFCYSDPSQAFRFLKGGSWKDFVEVNLRPEFRWYCKPDEKMNSFGFRCLLKPN